MPRLSRNPKASTRYRRDQVLLGWVFITPIVLVIGGLVIYPVIAGFIASLYTGPLGVPELQRFVGLDNYLKVLVAPSTLTVTARTLAYTGVSLAFEVTIGLIAALTLNRHFRGRGIALAILILPWALPGVVKAVLWSRILDADTGLLNGLLLQLNLIDRVVLWLANPAIAIVAIAAILAWGTIPLVTLILLAGLQAIPGDLYDAASVDGADRVAKFRNITIPLLRPAIFVVLVVGTIVGVAIFDIIYTMNGFGLTTRSIMMEIYLTIFTRVDFGRGIAFSFLLMAFAVVVAGLQLIVVRKAAR